MTMKQIAVIDQGVILGGAEVANLQLLRALRGRARLTLITSKDADPNYLKLIPTGVEVVTLPLPRLRIKKLLRAATAMHALRRYLRHRHFDLLHTNTARAALYSSLAPHALLRTHYMHDLQIPRWARAAQRRFAHIFCCSKTVENHLHRLGLKLPMSTIYNPFDFRTLQAGITAPAQVPLKTIGIIGRIDTWKGQDTFIEVAKLRPQWQFVIFGASTPHDTKTLAFEGKLRAMVAGYNLDNVEFAGWQPVTTALSRIDALCHLSTQTEPLGRPVVEALATGRPVIATYCGGPEEILSAPPLNNWLVPMNQPNIVAEKLDAISAGKYSAEDCKQAVEQAIAPLNSEHVADIVWQTWQGLWG